jgi:uncharacterized protein
MSAFDPLQTLTIHRHPAHHGAVKRLLQVIALTSMLSALACSDGKASSSQPERSAASPVVAVRSASLPLTGRVTDAASVLSHEQRARLSAKLEQLERSTHHQMVVVTVPALSGRDVADFTRDLANEWGIGRKGYDDGVVLLVAPNERKVRIAVGYGLEGTLTHEVCQQIIDTAMLPRFRHRDISGGIEAGTDALIVRLR